MEEVYVVRHRHLVERIPIRQIAREMGISRNVVRRYLREETEPGKGKPRDVDVHGVERTRHSRRLHSAEREVANCALVRLRRLIGSVKPNIIEHARLT